MRKDMSTGYQAAINTDVLVWSALLQLQHVGIANRSAQSNLLPGVCTTGLQVWLPTPEHMKHCCRLVHASACVAEYTEHPSKGRPLDAAYSYALLSQPACTGSLPVESHTMPGATGTIHIEVCGVLGLLTHANLARHAGRAPPSQSPASPQSIMFWADRNAGGQSPSLTMFHRSASADVTAMAQQDPLRQTRHGQGVPSVWGRPT